MGLLDVPSYGRAELDDRLAALGAGVVVVDAPSGGDDTASIDAALAAAAAMTPRGVVVFRAGAAYRSAGGHVQAPGVVVLGQNALIKHTGDNLLWKYADTESTDYTSVRAGISDLLVRGNPGSSARGFEIADTYGYRMQRVRIGSKYEPQDRYGSGAAVTLHNETRWAEGVELLDVHSIYNQVGLRATRSASSPSNSFNGLRTDRFEANIGSGQVGFELGLNGLDTLLYNGWLSMILWLEGQGSVGVDVGTNVRLRSTTYAHIVGECFGTQVSDCVFVNNRGGQFAPDGQVHCWHHEGCVDVVDAGDARTVYGGHVLGDSFTRANVRATVLGRRDDNDNPTHAGFGFSHDKDEDTARAWGYAGPAASKVFAVSARPFSADPAARFDAEAATRFGVRADGGLVLGGPAVEAAGSLGAVARRVAAYDRDGNLLGYVPLYAPGT